jgi:hypothetical protein
MILDSHIKSVLDSKISINFGFVSVTKIFKLLRLYAGGIPQHMHQRSCDHTRAVSQFKQSFQH